MTYRRILALVLVVTLTACEGDSPSDADAVSAESVEEATSAKAGEPIELTSRTTTEAHWSAPDGVVFEADSASWYLPPLDDGEYVVTADADGRQIYMLEVAVKGAQPDAFSKLTYGSDGSVEGGYGAASFKARKTADGAGEATYRLGEEILVSTVTADDRGSVSWLGTTLDGIGALSEGERAALDSLAGSGLNSPLTFVPLELACQQGAEDVDPVVGAAIVLPWQLMLKYLSSYPAAVARHFAGMASCDYFPDVTRPRDSSAVVRPPNPNIMVLNNESPLPAALYHFPLDGNGALSAPSMAVSN